MRVVTPGEKNTNIHVSFFKLLIPLAMTLLMSACGGGSGGEGGDNGPDLPGLDPDPEPDPVVETFCPDVHIVNLSRDNRQTGSCALASTRESVADCVESSIRNNLPASCLASFDVFVPGTAAEHGAWRQFNSLRFDDSRRGYLSLQYQDDEFIGDNNFDALLYDQGVLDGRDSLDELLYTIKTRFNSEDVRVFGHSKGSHAVALAADDPEFSEMEFYAFAQPGRTATDISGRGDIGKGKLGDPGYIHKLSSNLMGITWQNDEVKFYQGGPEGLLMPEKWGFPGYIWQDTIGGTLSTKQRIDHHNTYGGRYTDGLSNNDWRAGEGRTGNNFPYCATGDKSAYDNGECKKQRAEFAPWFWNVTGCREKVFEMMENGSTGDKFYIGYSGPRTETCTEDNGTISVAYGLEYNMNLADQDDCRYELSLKFQGIGSRPDGGSISVSSTKDTGWKSKTGTVRVPYHMRLRIKANMVETGNTNLIGVVKDCGHLTAASEGYVRKLHFTFNHPETGKRITRTIIGLGEGSDYPWPINLDMQNNVAWWNWDDPGDSRDTWDLFYAPLPNGGGPGSLMIKGDTDENRKGWFYKWVHLLD